MINRFFFKNVTVGKFWLTEITGTPPEVIPNIMVGINRPKFQEVCIGIRENIRGLRVSKHFLGRVVTLEEN